MQEPIALVLGGLGEQLEMLGQIVNGHLRHDVSPGLIELHAELTVVAPRF
jgi:hypothetical protein